MKLDWVQHFDIDEDDHAWKQWMRLNTAVAEALGRIPTPKRIIVNEESKVTVVLWEDGDKTIVRMCELDEYDPYAAYCAAFAKKCYGTNSKLKKTIERLTVYQESKPKKGEKE